MRIYRISASLIACGVIVQAALIAYATAALGHWIYDDHHTATHATFAEGSTIDYGGKTGFDLHGELGALWLPLLALAFLVVAFVTRRSVGHGLRWAAIVVALMALQAALGFATHAVAALAVLHAVNALALFSTAAYAATRVASGHDRSVGSGREQPLAVELEGARMREVSA